MGKKSDWRSWPFRGLIASTQRWGRSQIGAPGHSGLVKYGDKAKRRLLTGTFARSTLKRFGKQSMLPRSTLP
eukprot:352057-Chlamydomonas_euryale.AAC.2